MPWIITPVDPEARGPFKVRNKITGQVKGTHATYEKARRQQAALYVHAGESFTQDLDDLLAEFTGSGAVGGAGAGGNGTTSANVGSYARPFPSPMRLPVGKRKKRTPMPKLTTPQAMVRGGREQ